MKTKTDLHKKQCIVCLKPVWVTNPNSRKKVNTHPEECRRLYHNYRMALIRKSPRLAARHKAAWGLTRLQKRDTRSRSTGRSAALVTKGRKHPVSPRVLKKDSGALS